MMVRFQCEAKVLAFQSVFCFRPELVLPRLLGSDQIDADYWQPTQIGGASLTSAVEIFG